MRVKSFILFLLSVIFVFFFIIFIGGHQRPTIQTIVTETHKHINNLKNFKDNLRYVEEKRLQAEEKHLNLLGFTENPRLYPNDIWTNTSLPVIVTALFKGEEDMGIGFVRNTGHMVPNHIVLIYDIGLSSSSLQTVMSYCNTSRCQVVHLDLTEFPTHVQDEPRRTVRPLVIQDALNKAGAVLYIDNNLRLTSHIEKLFNQKPIGSFVTRQAVTSLTHPNMMDYFRTSIESFLFLPMIEMSRLLLWNTVDVHTHIMLPWIQCVLTAECIHPIGAQSEGCRFNKKPLYRYSGCHAYDSSALNIVLGLFYKLDETNYTFPMHDTFFTTASPLENLALHENNTIPSS